MAASGDAHDIYIEDYRLHIECSGRGAPAVILDAGLGGSSLEWVFVVERLRRLTKVCTYDRAGYGGSDTGPLPRTSSRIVSELKHLLESAGVAPPYVLAGHSFGGYNMQLFARRFPSLVAGLVLVDTSHCQSSRTFRGAALEHGDRAQQPRRHRAVSTSNRRSARCCRRACASRSPSRLSAGKRAAPCRPNS